MRKFIEKNWFKVTVIFILVVILVFLIVNTSTEKSKNEKTVDYAEKVETCSKQAQIVLNEKKDNSSDSASVTQQNHYNKLLNKCFVKLNTILLNGYDGTFVTVELMDAYESRNFISCMMLSAEGKNTQSCTIPASVSKTGITETITWDEGTTIMDTYMKN